MGDVKKAGISYDITPVPSFKDGKPATPFVGVQSFFVASKGKSKTLAQEFVANYVTNKDVAKALYAADPRPPALTEALQEVGATDPDAGKFMDAGKNGLPMPAIPEMAGGLGAVRHRRGGGRQGRRRGQGRRGRAEGHRQLAQELTP